MEASGRSTGLSFPVVTVGTSAPGVDAFTAVLKGLPSKSGMAFVLIPHPEPDRHNALTTLLSVATMIPVLDVSDGMPVEPDHIYVIPPNNEMTILEGVFHLAACSESSELQRHVADALECQVEEARDLAVRTEQRGESILNSLLSHVAVIAEDGTILSTNDAWNRFALDNGHAPLSAVGPGANYLDVCRRAMADGVADARAALKSLRNVLNARTPFERLEYACHAPGEQRWFLMNIAPLKGPVRGAVIVHINITDRKKAELEAKKNESMIRALLDSSAQSVIVVGSDEKLIMANAYSSHMFGYAKDELLGLPLGTLLPPESRHRHAEHHQVYFEKMQSRPMGTGMSLEALRKDGTRFPVEVGLSGIETPEGKRAVAFVTDITRRRQLEMEAQTHAVLVQALAARLLTAQEGERRRVSRELHDQICQQLAAIAIDLSGFADMPLPTNEERVRRIREMRARIVKASEATRHIAYQLHPSTLDDLGLVASLRALCKEFSQREGMATEFDNGAMPAEIPLEVASCVYRVAQEGLQNIALHSKAKHVSISLRVEKGALTLSVLDDGTGFNMRTVRGKGRLGLIGMEERARLVNGALSVSSRPRHGTRIVLSVPLANHL